MRDKIDCHVIQEAQKALSASDDLTRALKRLRNSRRSCQKCSRLNTCQVWQTFNQQIDIAIREVTEEWNLTV
jgi:hypothetical protein